MLDDPVEDAIAQAKAYYRKIEATDMQLPQYAFWIVNHFTEQRRQWVAQVQDGLSDCPKIVVRDLDGEHSRPARGHNGIYCLWDAATAERTPDEVKAALGMTFVRTISALNTMLQHHQLIINRAHVNN